MNYLERLSDTCGLRMPRILYGTAWKKEKTAACVERALTLGFRGVDTACQPKHYFEAGVGEGISAFMKASGVARTELYIQTKFTSLSGQDPKQVPYEARASLAEQVAQSFQVSLRNLQTQYLDCLVLHSPLEKEEATRAAWIAMEALIDQGGVKQIGISNCYDPGYFARLNAWARIKPAVLQNRFYDTTGYDKQLREYCQEHGIVYQSFWTLTANPHLLAHNVVQSLGSTHGRTPAQILLRYLIQEGVVPLTGTQSEAHMRDDLSLFDFSLTAAERHAVTRLLA